MTRHLKSTLKWFYPGLKIKRWMALCVLGGLLFLLGLGIRTQALAELKPFSVRAAEWFTTHIHTGLKPLELATLLTVGGGLLCVGSFVKFLKALVKAVDPDASPLRLGELIYERRKLQQGRKIVVIGGGTGLSTMLRGLKQYSDNLTAIVTVADDGGSSGKLMKQLGILPPGDIRNCLVALADAETEMTELFQYRFRNSVNPAELNKNERTESGQGYGEGLRDHSFGNLLIAAMCAIKGGDFEAAVRETSRVLNIRGRVLPSTVTHVRLRGEMDDGSFVEGESAIASSPLKIKRVHLVPGNACPAEEVIEAILSADVIVLGPGSVFTSIVPNLLIEEIPEAIRRSAAKKVYVCNVMTQPGETDQFTAYDHVKAIEVHARQRVFDYVLVNQEMPAQNLVEKYKKSGAVPVMADTDRLKADGYRPISGNFINQTDFVRHDAGKLAKAIVRLLG